MRKIFSSKTHWFIALILAATLVFGFAGCSSDSDDDDDSTTTNNTTTTVAVYKGTATNSAGDVTGTVTFLSDGTFSWGLTVGNISIPALTGTYSGNPAADGILSMTIKKAYDDDSEQLVDYTGNDGTFPLEITDGKFSFNFDEDELESPEIEYTRQ